MLEIERSSEVPRLVAVEVSRVALQNGIGWSAHAYRVYAMCGSRSALRSARLPVNLIGSPINYVNRLIGSPITSQSTGGAVVVAR